MNFYPIVTFDQPKADEAIPRSHSQRASTCFAARSVHADGMLPAKRFVARLCLAFALVTTRAEPA